MKIREINAKITLSHSDFPRYKIKGFSEALDFLNERAVTFGNYTNAYNMLSPVGYHNIALRYTAPFGMTVGGDYTRYSENRSQSLFKEYDYQLGSVNRQNINRWHVYVDKEHQLGKWQLNYGMEYQYSKDHSSQHYALSDNPDFDDILNEDVASFYAGTQRSFDWGLSFNLSAKGEYYHNKYQHNWNFIPQFGATYYKTPKNIFQLNFNTQRIYPSYWELHGGTSHINDYSTIIGNPKLQPYIQYDAQFNYILRQKYVATLYFQYGDKTTVQLPYQSPDALNLIYQREFGIRNAIKKLNRQLEKVAYSFGNFADI